MSSTLEVLDVDAVAALLKCAPKTVEERARKGDLPGINWGSSGWVFPAGALSRRLDEIALEMARERAAPGRPSAVLTQVGGKASRRKALPVLPGMK